MLVNLQVAGHDDTIRGVRAIGPLTWTRARQVSDAWEYVHGQYTTRITDRSAFGVAIPLLP